MKLLACFCLIVLTGCTSTVYTKTIGQGDTAVTTRVDHYSVGWDREGVIIGVDKTSDAEVKARISVSKSNGSESTKALAEAMTETIANFK